MPSAPRASRRWIRSSAPATSTWPWQKKSVYGHVSIDSVAGPSEILVLADEMANPRYVAADLLSQAEHDELASAILVTTSEALAKEVSDWTDRFIRELSRGEIIRKSLDNYGHILLADTLEDAIDAANEIASEHMEIVTADPFEVMTKIRNAGAIFIGEYSSEPLGDYFAGPNHVLPTNGTAKFFSPLSVDDFIKKIQHHLLLPGCAGEGPHRYRKICGGGASDRPCQFHQSPL